MGLFTKIFGTYSDRELKRITPTVDVINEFEPDIKKLSDNGLRDKTTEFKERLVNGETLDDILPEAFAVVREASRRVLGMRHFDVQLIGGIVLHQGRIAEMKTGEGKTLVATLPVYLNALTGKGVHVVTVNDYLAKRDSDWMGKIYSFLGLSVGTIVHGLTNAERREAYNCDITYGTNHEYGFDYLRDNMVIYKENKVQRELNYAIVDEVDSILIDEARTPLIISGSADKSTELYGIADKFVKRLKPLKILRTDEKETYEEVEEDYIIDEKANSVALTSVGVKRAEEYFNIDNLSDPDNLTISHHINQALRANGIMKRDIDYVVKDGEVVIVDEFTGRLMYGRRYNDGLHQAIEAKENVKVARESVTQATITYQNFFRMYKKLSGMTGTAQTEEAEFNGIYNLDVIVIPTNKPLIRKDNPDCVFKTEKGKFNAVIDDVIEAHEQGQPVLIGTISIEKSELLSSMLKKRGVKHNVLNAKHHEKEAEIVAQAGKLGEVTIATNMAGRGTDIVLGGNPEFMAKQEMKRRGYDDVIINEANGFNETDNQEIIAARKEFRTLEDDYKEATDVEKQKVLDAGGLYIIGTERHESRRIDNQLRGRAGRQGDPGMTRFYISLEDDLMRLFGSDRLTGLVDAIGLEEDQPIEHRMLSNAIETAQKRVEGNNYQIRKNVLQYDDVMNQQREIIYKQRMQVLDGDDLSDYYLKMIETRCAEIVDAVCGSENDPENWNWDLLVSEITDLVDEEDLEYILNDKLKYLKDVLSEDITKFATEKYNKKEQELGSELMRELERVVLLRVVDEKWMDHIDAIDQLKYGIGLRGYAQRDPILDYKFEAFEMFDEMIMNIKSDTLKVVLNAKINKDKKLERKKVATGETEILGENRKNARNSASDNANQPEAKVTVVKKAKVGRNDPCPCGSGKKYKNCCGLNE